MSTEAIRQPSHDDDARLAIIHDADHERLAQLVFYAEYEHHKDMATIGEFLGAAAKRLGWKDYDEVVRKLSCALYFPWVHPV